MTGETRLPSGYKSKEALSVMKNLYLDIDRKEQGRIVTKLMQKIGLTSRKLVSTLGWCRASLFLYLQGKARIPYSRFSDLCRLAEVDPREYALKFVILERQKGAVLDLSSVDEVQFQTLESAEWQKVVAAGILTDGSLYYRKFDNKYLIRFYSSDLNMHSFFQKAVLIGFGEHCSATIKKRNENVWITHYIRSTKNVMVRKLLSFSRTYSTTKGNCPSLHFLLNEKENVKIHALRFAMSCDGSISIKKDGGRSLKLACAHPKLALQFKQLFEDIGIMMNLTRDKNTWSGVQGLESHRNDSIKRYAEIGGFLPQNVKVTNGNRVGMLKNDVLNMAVERINSHSTKPL